MRVVIGVADEITGFSSQETAAVDRSTTLTFGGLARFRGVC